MLLDAMLRFYVLPCKCLKYCLLTVETLNYFSSCASNSVPHASRIRPLQYAEESEEFPLWNAPQLQPPTGLANNWGNYSKCSHTFKSTLHASVSSNCSIRLIWCHNHHTCLCPAFVQDPLPPTEDPWAFQTANLLPRNNLWPRPVAAPAGGGNVWMETVWLFKHESDCWTKCSTRRLSDFFLVTVQVILELRERPDRAAKARRGLTLSLQPLKGFDYDSFLSPPATPDTQLDACTQTHTAAPLPGPVLALQPTQEKGPRREVFVWQTLSWQYGN